MSINLSSINLNNSQKAISFKAKIKDPVFAKKHLQALLTQDIYSPKLKIKRPETTLEKETLIEILKNRLNLDKYVRLTNERFLAITSIFLINEMIHNNNTNNDEYKNLRAEIDKKGNLKSYFNTLDKSIEMETKKNKHSIDFFKEIEKNEEELIEKKLLKPNELNKFYEQVTKYNINKDGNLSTKELLEIIEKDINTNDSQKKVNTNDYLHLPRKTLFNSIENFYRDILLKEYNIYAKVETQRNVAQQARIAVQNEYKKALEKIPNYEIILHKHLVNVEGIILYKTTKLGNTPVIPLDEVIEEIDRVEKHLKEASNDIKDLKEKLSIDSKNRKLKIAYNKKDKEIKALKESWIESIIQFGSLEEFNRRQMNLNDVIEEYDFLTSKNTYINRNREIYNILKNNKNKLPEETWQEIISKL